MTYLDESVLKMDEAVTYSSIPVIIIIIMINISCPSIMKTNKYRLYNTCIDSAVLTERILKRKGRSLVGYPCGTLPTETALSERYDDKSMSDPLSLAGPDGCVPIL